MEDVTLATFYPLLVSPIPELDVYEPEGLASSDDYPSMSPTTRAEAERAMRERDRAEGLAAGDLRRGIVAGKSIYVFFPLIL